MLEVTIQQALVFLLSGAGIYCFSCPDKFKYGFVFGLLSQPFWFYETFQKAQWGMFLLSFWFTYCHLKGIKYNFATNISYGRINGNECT